jgi:hypothetical protein
MSLRSCDAHELFKLIEHNHPELSVSRQCARVGLARSTFSYQPTLLRELTLRIIARI